MIKPDRTAPVPPATWKLAIFAVFALSAAMLGAASADGSPQVLALIDACQYPDAAAARAAWEPMGGTSPVVMEAVGGRQSLRMKCNFKGTAIERASWDRSVNLDLASCTGIQFQLLCRDASPVSQFCIYFKSGNGWYRAGFFPESPKGWNTVTIDKASTTAEGTPAGWGKISAIRISAWRGSDADTEFFLGDIRKT
ncbi:MAG: hypothetical protein WCH98_16555, partial [Verrucomicrobiota bacterium]